MAANVTRACFVQSGRRVDPCLQRALTQAGSRVHDFAVYREGHVYDSR